jgi:aryl-alcohol dehydrogenase-like predicted oxidoreductase
MATTTATRTIPSLASYHLLGRSGLRVSPLCLGTMTFGTEWGWGSAEDTARAIFARYLEAGGNFIDTANGYTNGTSEELIGGFLRDMQNRDAVVLATKYTFGTRPGDPNGGGNGRKHTLEALEASLRRLKTDYVDLYWMHAWDVLTPVEEVMSTLDTLVKSGKVRYIGLSDTPAWYLARAQTIAEWRGFERVCALQLEYSLVERNIEREHVPAALALGMGITPWSPLGSGLLTGKYVRGEDRQKSGGRLTALRDSSNPGFTKLFTERNYDIVEALVGVAKELERSPAQVALNWITKRPGVASTIIGATKLAQLEDNLAALEFDIPAALSTRLEEASRPEPQFPELFWSPAVQAMVRGGTEIRTEPRWYRGPRGQAP